MSLPRTQRLRRTSAAPESLAIGPEEYFVLSRIDGSATVGELVGGSGLPAADAERIVARLVEVGALEKVDVETTTRPAPTKALDLKSPNLRERADSRRRLLLQQQFGGTRPRTTTPTPAAAPAAPAAPAAAPDDPPPIVVALAEPDDPRIDHGLPIPPNEQRWLLALDDRFDDLTPFELLGLHPTDDDKRIKKAYFDTSRRLHPDTYYGKGLGVFKPRLDKLFARAKQAYAELRKPEVRRPYVAVHEAQIAEKEAAERAAREKAERIDRERREREREKLRATRLARQQERARERDQRLKDKLDAKVDEYLVEAERALEVKNLARASNFFRLALQSDPNNDEIRARWEQTREESRKERAKIAYGHALTYLEIGQFEEAKLLVVEAAEADPQLEHLAHAADLLRDTDTGRAREFALKALERLNAAGQAAKPTFDIATGVRLRVMIARAFAAAGQTKTATELAKAAREARPDDPEVRALLKSLKVT